MESKHKHKHEPTENNRTANNVIDKVTVYFGGVDVDGGACDVTEAAPESILESRLLPLPLLPPSCPDGSNNFIYE